MKLLFTFIWCLWLFALFYGVTVDDLQFCIHVKICIKYSTLEIVFAIIFLLLISAVEYRWTLVYVAQYCIIQML